MYVVKGQLSWGHCLKIYDPEEQQELGTVKEEILTCLLYTSVRTRYCSSTLRREISLRFSIGTPRPIRY